ncbi:uncharacterized protein [Diabrotica undecimpunctata]|uniref:uncharacterized protein n=1 Tax=Diabrotica undecimpunctata TaxID=50387 RepID=UPI003B635AEF
MRKFGMINPRHHPGDEEVALSFKRPCVCTTENVDLEKNFVYIEGTKTDKNISANLPELTENVWYEIRPPKLFSKQPIPLVTSRQTYITRVLLDGKLTHLTADEEDGQEEKSTIKNVSINIKKSAARFLGRAGVDFDF